MDVTVVSGVPGVGASRVSESARSELGAGYELVNMGDVMLEEAAVRGLVSSRDDLATVPLGELRQLQRRAGEYVASRARGNQLIVNTHLVVATVHGFVAGLPDVVLEDVDPNRFVLIESDPDLIAERRRDETYREYREHGARSIGFHQDLVRAAAMAYTASSGAPVRFIDNSGPLEDAVADLVSIVSGADPAD